MTEKTKWIIRYRGTFAVRIHDIATARVFSLCKPAEATLFDRQSDAQAAAARCKIATTDFTLIPSIPSKNSP